MDKKLLREKNEADKQVDCTKYIQKLLNMGKDIPKITFYVSTIKLS